MKFTKSQLDAINHKKGPALVLAVPGAGKTTVLLERIRQLSKTIDPKHVLSITFSKSQADDMRKRFKDKNVNFMTIHALCYLIIRYKLKKENKQLRLLEDENNYNKYHLLRDIYKKINNKAIPKEENDAFFTAISLMKNSMLDVDYLDNINVKNIKNIFYQYESFKKENHYFDFDDMQIIAYNFLQTDQNLLKRLKRQYKYVQIDEGQDTSLLQFKIIEKLIYPENNLMIVADDDQSIYSFRGANPDYLLNLKKVYPNVKVIYLNENHRSQKNIVNLADTFIRQNKKRYIKEVRSVNDKKGKIKAKYTKNNLSEYEYIIKNIDSNSTNAIIYRNNISAISLMNFLYNKNIKFSVINSKLDFFESKILKDVIDIINFSEDQKDLELFEKIYYKIDAYIKKEWIDYLKFKPKNMNIFDFLSDKLNLNDFYIELFDKKKKEFYHIKKLSLAKKISFIANHLGYSNYIYSVSHKYKQIIVNKDIYFETLEYFCKDLNDLNELYDKISIFKKLLNNKVNTNISLSTIHGVKGLEFDQVFVIDLVENEFPISHSDKNQIDLIEEERRIFYVAVTRAKNKLHLITLKSRNNIKCEKSQFYDFVLKSK
ncbi:MAG: ATP-dependent helicase [Tissierellia bacterium]|nr:ATP-dependent helicase [Tissierellia bacterium]